MPRRSGLRMPPGAGDSDTGPPRVSEKDGAPSSFPPPEQPNRASPQPPDDVAAEVELSVVVSALESVVVAVPLSVAVPVVDGEPEVSVAPSLDLGSSLVDAAGPPEL